MERNKLNRCDRECNNCDLIQDTDELLDMYSYFILAGMGDKG